MSAVSLRALDRYRFLLFAWLLTVVLGTLAIFSYQITNVFIEAMRPDFEAKAVLVSDTIAAQFLRASDLNLEVADLRGLPSFLDDTIDNHPEFAYALVAIPDKGVIYAASRFATDTRISTELRAHVRAKQTATRSISFNNIVDVVTPLPRLGADNVLLHVGVDEKYIQTRLLEIKIDLFITLFVAVVITLEVLFFVVLLTLDRQSQTIRDFLESVSAGVFPLVPSGNDSVSSSPLARSLQNATLKVNTRYRALLQNGAAANLSTEPRRLLRKMLANIDEKFQFSAIHKSLEGDASVIKAIRLPMFIFFFSTDLSRPFWPIFVGGFPPPMAGVDQSLLMALPMAMWALTMMVVTPFGPRLVRLLGVRKALLGGMVPAAVGTMMCAFASGYVELVLWRCVTAAGFGIVGVTGILYVTMAAQAGRSARSAAVFIGAQTAAGVCGTALGGVLADRLGYPGTLMVSAAIIACNCFLVARIISTVSPARAGSTDNDN
ncbi:MAG: MFS transporter, partial [Burkholderiales bacterium]|nr:MFS transporter [Burkholderiales bacterium]